MEDTMQGKTALDSRTNGPRIAVVLFVLLFVTHAAYATSSTTFWTPMTEDIQPFGVVHLGIDDYFRLDAPHDPSFFTDFTAPTVGVLPFTKIQMEVGADYFANAPHPWLFNAKIGAPEGSWFKNQPALEIGIFDAGGKYHLNPGESRMDFDVLYGVVGKTIPKIGRLSAGPYFGNHAALISSAGKPENVGFMIAFDRAFGAVKATEGQVGFNRWDFAVDYASGKNAIGAAGGGFYYYFTPNISLLVGPTFFNDKGINGRWKLSTQLDINMSKLFGRK
jgi:hypothetical protein